MLCILLLGFADHDLDEQEVDSDVENAFDLSVMDGMDGDGNVLQKRTARAECETKEMNLNQCWREAQGYVYQY